MIRPQSLVFDSRGIYFDATKPSDLEYLLQTTDFSDAELREAAKIRKLIVQNGLTKYNLDPPSDPSNHENLDIEGNVHEGFESTENRLVKPKTDFWFFGRQRRTANSTDASRKVVNLCRLLSDGRVVLLVPGQVEDDASVRFGCTTVRSNLDLLKAVRRLHPDAWIMYRPHPDVTSGNRKGNVAFDEIHRYADYVESDASVISCIEACDEVHTMTSLTGFDALLRGKRVVTYGQPFYAGWGLTSDLCENGVALARRSRRLTIEQLVAGVLLRYPVYWDWNLRGYTTCEAVIHSLIRERDELMGSGRFSRLRTGSGSRLLRKLKVLIAAWSSAL